MKKKIQIILTILVIAAIAICAGCAKKQEQKSYILPIEANGTFDVGLFTVDIPTGWTIYQQGDMTKEPNALGIYPKADDVILFAKCDVDTDELAAVSSKPNIRIFYYEDKDAITPIKELYDQTEKVSGVKINGKDCDSSIFYTDGLATQEIIYETNDATYAIEILCSINGKDVEIAWDDKEVLPILESIKTK